MGMKKRWLGFSTHITVASSLVILTGLVNAQRAMAQDEDTEQSQKPALLEEVVVTGIKQNLQNAQDIKREADTFVDAISAEDIGALPDRSVLEAIQRLPGVSVERFAGPDDPDHFSVEGSGAIIRGMTQTRSEFNGRDSFSATSGRGLSFQDVPPELVGGVDVYKHQTADMIEGGIGGTISLRTRKPFDSAGRMIGFNVDYSYGDIAEKWSPTFSGLFSDRYETDLGEFGVLVNYANSRLYGESHGIQSDAYISYDASTVPGAERLVANPGIQDGKDGIVWVPSAANALAKFDDREREGLAASVQWSSPDETIETTLEYIRSDATLTWTEHAIKYQSGYGTFDNRRSAPLAGTEFEFSDDGIFESGTLVTSAGEGWRASGHNLDHLSRSWGDNSVPQFGQKTQFDTRMQRTNNVIEDINFNIKWQVNDQLELAGDLQRVDAKSEIDDLVVHTGTYAATAYNVGGSTPSVTFLEPWLGVRDENRANGGTTFETHPAMVDTTGDGNADSPRYPNGYPGFTGDPAGDSNYFQDPNSYFWRSAMDKYDRSEGDSTAIRLDATYDFEEDGFLKSMKTGVRWAKRDQINRDTDYDWGSVGPEYSSNYRAFWLMDDGDDYTQGAGEPKRDTDVSSQLGDFEYYDWSDFHGGGVVNIAGNTTIHPSEAFVQSLIGANPSREIILSPDSSFIQAPLRDGVDAEFGLFLPDEINSISETNQAIYVKLDFGGDDELRYSGNFGLRYVSLERETAGWVKYPDLDVGESSPPVSLGMPLTAESVRTYLQSVEGDFADMEAAITANPWVNDSYYYLTDEERAFGNSTDNFVKSKVKFNNLLPSFNIKTELTSDLIARFAVAKAVAYPDIGDVRQRQLMSGRDTVRIENPPPEEGMEPEPIDTILQGAFIPGWDGSGGNPDLEPMKSTQYDVALEWYFDDVGQLSGTIFHKSLDKYFIKGGQLRPFTNPSNGITQLVDFDTTINGPKAKMDGFELAYQQFFSGMFDGFGVQATYTYIDAAGSPNSDEALENESWYEDVETDTGIRVNLSSLPLQGQSKETVNLVGMYEKDGWKARLAYNWRSKYLLTTRDVISKAPLFYDDHGQLDASVFYDVTDNLTVGIQGTNITNSQSETLMVLNNELKTAGRSWFVADRRVAFVVRGTF